MRKSTSFTCSLVLCLLTLCSSAIAQWQPIGRPSFARQTQRDIANIAADGSSILAQTANDSTFISLNKGLSWLPTNFPHLMDIKTFGSVGNLMYAVGTDNWIAMSSNTGVDWLMINKNITGNEIRSFTLVGDVAIAGSNNGNVYRLANGGTSWIAAKAGLPNSAIMSLAYSGTALIAGTQYGGVYYSSDTGTSWHAASIGGIGATRLAANSYVALATTDKGVFASKDDGRTWSEASAGLGSNVAQQFTLIGSNAFATTFTGGVFMSSDRGDHWVSVNNGLPTLYIIKIAAIDSTLYAVTFDHHLYSSTTSGSSWAPVTIATEERVQPLPRALLARPDALIVGSNTFGILRTTDDGADWHSAGVDAQSITALGTSGTTLFAGGPRGIYHSEDNGVSWQKGQLKVVQGQDSVGIDTVTLCSQFASNDLGTFAALIAYSGHGGLYLTTDGGAVWNHFLGSNSQAMITSGVNCFASVSNNFDPSALLSTDRGNNWSECTLGLPSSWITCFAFLGTTLFAGTANDGVYYTSNMGASWLPVATGSTSNRVSSLRSVGSLLIAGTAGGVYVSGDAGVTWKASNTGLLSLNIRGIEIFNDTVFAVGDNDVYRRSLTQIRQNADVSIAGTANAVTAYPNPATNDIAISGIARDEQVTIYNSLGFEVAHLASDLPGNSITWHTADVPSGSYFAAIRDGSALHRIVICVQH